MNEEKPSFISLSYAKTSDETRLNLRKDHEMRPLWIDNRNKIFLETFSPVYKPAKDFIVSFCEPVSRPKWIQEYRVTKYSLYTALSLGLTPEHIVKVLDKFSKCDLPNEFLQLMKENSVKYGKVKVVLRRGKYYLEILAKDCIDELLSDESLLSMLIFDFETESTKSAESTKYVESLKPFLLPSVDQIDLVASPIASHASYRIKDDCVQMVIRKCNAHNLPAFEEYDFKSSDGVQLLNINLKPFVKLRPYQSMALNKMFGSGMARSGVIVLPCGAGKTLLGVAAATTVNKITLVLCMSNVSIHQWASEFFKWSNIKPSQIIKFMSSDQKDNFIFSQSESADNATSTASTFDAPSVVVTTYSMLAYSGKRSYEAQKMMDFVSSNDWGLLILDEAHVIPAAMFSRALNCIKTHVRLGLTATFVREDKKIDSLNYLIGPKLYEADWLNLADQGFIAKAICTEIWCQMTKEFYHEYLRASARRKQYLYVMNPYKIQTFQYLIKKHSDLGDKIIAFSDNIPALKLYAGIFNVPYIYGGTSNAERINVLQNFRYSPTSNILFISKIGDTSIDLPEATCLIQISSHYGSRRQEAQRLGRILRTQNQSSSSNVYFYTLVSRDTNEVYYSSKRHKFLLDQGYPIKIVTSLEVEESYYKSTELVYSTLREQLDLLNTILVMSDNITEGSSDDGSDSGSNEGSDDGSDSGESPSYKFPYKKSSNLQSLSGGTSMAYMEFSKNPFNESDTDKRRRYNTRLSKH